MMAQIFSLTFASLELLQSMPNVHTSIRVSAALILFNHGADGSDNFLLMH